MLPTLGLEVTSPQDTTHTPEYYNPVFGVQEDHGTVSLKRLGAGSQTNPGQSHTSIVDRDGMAVSITSTVNYVFGSLIMDPVSGILMNNEVRSV
jgi:gamma-glutamyltranspeptidase/glutathione hydrolase/leukotriene-C4 hydrolase